MCLAIYKPEKVKLHRADLKRAFDQNSDGAGFAYYDPSQRRVIIEKGFFIFSEFWRAFQEVQRDCLKAIVHFRWATHGTVGHDNCHPYDLKDGALIHNGMIDCTVRTSYNSYGDGYSAFSRIHRWKAGDDLYERGDRCGVVTGSYDGNGDFLEDKGYERATGSRSDTREFVEDWLSQMGEADMRKAKPLIEHAIGSGSKLVTLHDSGRHIIFNEWLGHWDRGAWWSNSCYRPVPPPSTTVNGAIVTTISGNTMTTREGNVVTVTNLTPTKPSVGVMDDKGVLTLPSKEYVEPEADKGRAPLSLPSFGVQ